MANRVQIRTNSSTLIAMIANEVANMIRFLVDSYNKQIPTILEIPSKDHPYDPAHDFVFSRVEEESSRFSFLFALTVEKVETASPTNQLSFSFYTQRSWVYAILEFRLCTRQRSTTQNMANNTGEGPSNDFLDQILCCAGRAEVTSQAPMMMQLNSGNSSGNLGGVGVGVGLGGSYGDRTGGAAGGGFPLGLNLEQWAGGFMKIDDTSSSRKRFRDDVVDSRVSSAVRPGFHGQPMPSSAPVVQHPPAIRPRVRARRGHATDPHSIAERLRRERIAERIRALQELVPNVNKSDRAVMIDEIVEYVKFLRLQVKVLSMSRLGGAGAVAPLVTDFPVSSVEEEDSEGGRTESSWERWSNDGTEQQVAKLLEENVGAAMQFLESKALCIMPISLASEIYRTQPPDTGMLSTPESNPP